MNYKRHYLATMACLIALLSIAAYRRLAPRPEQIVQVPKWSSALERVDMNAPTGAVVFIGDSHIAGLYTDNIATPSVNLGIGGDTTLGVLERIGRYQCIKTARAVVIEVGVNDLQWRTDDQITTNLFSGVCYAVRRANPTVPMFICGVPSVCEDRLKWKPVSNQRIDSLNSYYQLVCDRVGRELNLHYVDMVLGTLSRYDANHILKWEKHDLPSIYDSGDGIHLNRAGYQVLEKAIREALFNDGVMLDNRLAFSKLPDRWMIDHVYFTNLVDHSTDRPADPPLDVYVENDHQPDVHLVELLSEARAALKARWDKEVGAPDGPHLGSAEELRVIMLENELKYGSSIPALKPYEPLSGLEHSLRHTQAKDHQP